MYSCSIAGSFGASPHGRLNETKSRSVAERPRLKFTRQPRNAGEGARANTGGDDDDEAPKAAPLAFQGCSWAKVGIKAVCWGGRTRQWAMLISTTGQNVGHNR